ncbi:MAG TPA: glutamine amidotransferase family protein [Candidatus Saccharimonadales bacterium]|nr:glutamine amidotransferase family protein [Candidatus Saccharimonadales bacterium]
MCGIVGLFFKKKSLQPRLGEWFGGMLDCMSSRGPDSAGFAIYRNSVPVGSLKLTLQHPDENFSWDTLAKGFKQKFKAKIPFTVNSTHAIFVVAAKETAIRKFLREEFPEVKIMSIGHRIEIMKEIGLPFSVIERFHVRQMAGSHAIGHTRMATESAVTTAGSHPFSTGQDLCLVHNGSLSNHNRLRENLRREGIEFQTDNDSEVAAGYLTWRLKKGDSLSQALTHALKDLDGFYTFAVGTRNGFAVLRDPIACKPAVMAETLDYVAMSSEYRSLTSLPGIEKAKLWEPEPATVYSWSANGGE